MKNHIKRFAEFSFEASGLTAAHLPRSHCTNAGVVWTPEMGVRVALWLRS